jgi:signal transduction histidine kinase
MFKSIESVQKYLTYQALVIWRTKSFWIRAVLCWVIGVALLVNDEQNYDLRLQIRGPRPTKSNVLIVDVSDKAWMDFTLERHNVLRPLKEMANISDGFFWNPDIWRRLLTSILKGNPASVGVTFFFEENLNHTPLPTELLALLEDRRVVWASEPDNTGHLAMPAFATTFQANVGLKTLRSDDDGIVRRFTTPSFNLSHLAIRMAEIANPDLMVSTTESSHTGQLINFVGGVNSFEVVSFQDILTGRFSNENFKNRMILISNLGAPNEQLQTPIGRMSRAIVIANILDNLTVHNFIQRFPNWIYLLMLALLIGGSIWVLLTYPQSVALVILVLSSVIWSAASAWSFDTLHFWVPVVSPLLQMMITYIAFLSYQLAVNESRAWRLEQERKYNFEIEQLKNNFVSMMSHDLKTPIAKIQAICDRLLASRPEGELAHDLKSLRRSSDDLHRYIQSILKVTKIEAKDFTITREVTDINDDIEKVISRLAPLAQELKIALSTDLEPMFSIEADPNLIQEVIHNLVENALKYTPIGGRVKVSSQEKDDNVVVVVEDTGPGIALEDQKEIWGKFTRGRHPNAEIKGTGLGLYLVKYFVELHRGQVFLDSALGQGTKIGFAIPVNVDSPESE